MMRSTSSHFPMVMAGITLTLTAFSISIVTFPSGYGE
jgi:hypothetical protein